jgi:hypothetical protein
MTRKKASMKDAKASYEIQAEAQAQAKLNAIQINEIASHELEKMCTMEELFINDMMDSDKSDVTSDMEEEEEELTQAELDELTASLSA